MRVSFFAAAATLSVGFAAHAETFEFSFGVPGDAFYGSGTFTANPISCGDGCGYYQINGVNGVTYTDATHINMSAASPVTFEYNDNLIRTVPTGDTGPSGDTITAPGLAYTLDDGEEVSLKEFLGSATGQYYEEILWTPKGTLVTENEPLMLTDVPTSVTPEPSSIALLGTGMLGLAGFFRKRSA